MVWKGRRPAAADVVDVGAAAAGVAAAETGGGRTASPASRRASLGSENSSENAGSEDVRLFGDSLNALIKIILHRLTVVTATSIWAVS